MNNNVSLALVACVILTGCGKEIGRVPMSAEGTAQQDLTVTSGKRLALWTALDVTYTGNFAASYDVELIQSGTVVGKATCNPLDVNTTIGKREVTLNSKRSVSYSGKMKCELTPTSSGVATLKAKLSFTSKPADLVVRDFSLVAKQ